MKKHLFRAAFLLVVGCCMVACSGSDDVTTTDTPQQPQQPAANQAVQLEGTLGAKAGMTRSINADGTGSWQKGDQFAIYYPTTSGNATAIATVSGVNSEGGAEFKATLYGPQLGTSTVKFIYPATAHDGRGGIKKSVLANQEGTLDYISQQLDIETGEGTIVVEDRSPRDPKATLTANTTLQPQVCIYQFNLKKADGNPLKTTKFVAKEGTNTYTVSPAVATSSFCIAMLPAANADFTFTATSTDKAKIYQYQCPFVRENITTEHLGCVIATDGKVYKYGEVDGIEYSKSFTGKTIESAKFYSQNLTLDGGPSVTPVAMIAYVGANTGENAEGYEQSRIPFVAQKDTYTYGLAVSIYCVGGSKDRGGDRLDWAKSDDTPVNAYTNNTLADLDDTPESGLQYLKVSGYIGNHPAYDEANKYHVDGFENSDYGCSSWFMCSAYQLIQILNNYPKTYPTGYPNGVTQFFTDLRNIAGVPSGSGYNHLFPPFWTCTDTGSTKAWYIQSTWSYNITPDVKRDGNIKCVRPFFAF